MQANNNGFFYVLDRKTGEFLSGKAFLGGVTRASGLDGTGRPVGAQFGADVYGGSCMPCHGINAVGGAVRAYVPARAEEGK